MLKNPVTLLWFSWLLLLASINLPIINFHNEISFKTFILILSFLVLFSVGYVIGNESLPTKEIRKKYLSKEKSIKKINRIILIVALVGILGNFMLLVDFVIFRGINYSQGVTQARQVMQTAVASTGVQGSMWSIVARVFMGFSSVSALLLVLKGEYISKRNANLAILAIGSQFFVDSLSGGRNAMAISLVLILMGGLVRKNKKMSFMPKIKSFKLLKWVLPLILVTYFGNIFLEREELRERTLVDSLYNIQVGFNVTFPDFVWSEAQNPGMVGNVMFIVISLLMYVNHGIFELSYLLNYNPQPGPYFGLSSFYMVGLFGSKLGLISGELVNNAIYSIDKIGFYQTMLAPIYKDLGYFGTIFFSGFFGVFVGLIWRKLKINKSPSIMTEMLAAYILTIIVFSPIYFVVNISNGFQILVAIIITGLLSKVRL